MQRFRDNILIMGSNGLIPYSGSSVAVYQAGTSTLASIYPTNDPAGAKENPFRAGDYGEIDFYAKNGRYDLLLSRQGYQSLRITDLQIWDPANSDFVTDLEVDQKIANKADKDYVDQKVAGLIDDATPAEDKTFSSQKVSTDLAAKVSSDDLADKVDPGKGSSVVGYALSEVAKAALRTLHDRLTDQIHIKDFGAIGDGTLHTVQEWIDGGRFSNLTAVQFAFPHVTSTGDSIDWAALQGAIDFVSSRGGGSVDCASSHYIINNPVAIKANVHVSMQSGTVVEQVGSGQVFSATGIWVQDEGNVLAATASPGSVSISLDTGKGANFTPGSWALIVAEDLMWAENAQKKGEIVYVDAVAGDTLTLLTPVEWNYTLAQNAQVHRLELLEGVSITGGHIKNANPTTNLYNLIGIGFCLRPQIQGVTGSDNARAFIGFYGCVHHKVRDCTALDLMSDDDLLYLGYGINEFGANLGGDIQGMRSERVRHLYTTNISSVMPYGQPVGTRVNGTAIASMAAAFDTHAPGLDIEFDDCKAHGGKRVAFQIRSRRTKIRGGTATGFVGAAVWIPNGNGVEDATIEGLESANTNTGTDERGNNWTVLGAITDAGKRTVARANKLTRCGGQAIRAISGAVDPTYSQNIIVDPFRGSLAAAVDRAAIHSSASGLGAVSVDGNDISCADAEMNYGIKFDNSSISLSGKQNRIRGAQVADIVASSNQTLSGNSGPSLVSFGANLPASIDGGMIDLPAGSVVNVLAEGSVADDLTGISATGATVGNAIVLRRGGSAAVTVKHNVGNILLKGATDAVLDSSTKLLTLIYVAGSWVEQSRNF